MAPQDVELHLATASMGDVPLSPGYAEKKETGHAFVRELSETSSPYSETEDTVEFRTMRWWHVALLMFAETISLGILALPHATAKLGYLPGLMFILVFGVVASYAGYVIGQFKLRFPEVRNPGDVGFVLFSPLGSHAAIVGRRLFGSLSILFLVFIMAAHILSFGIMMNVVTGHATCSIVFLAGGAILSFILALPRTFKAVSWLSLGSLISILAAVFTTIIGVARLHPQGAQTTELVADKTGFTHGMVALMDIVMAFSGNVAFFSFMSEMRYPQEYPKSLITLQTSSTFLYLLVAALIYHFAGSSVSSPALSSAPLLLRKIAYYLAIPTIVVAGVINGHVALKMVFLAWKAQLAESKSRRAWGWWVGLNAALWGCAWVLAESVPDFGNLLALVSALLGTFFTYGLASVLYLFLNKGQLLATYSKVALTSLNCGLLVGAGALSVLGAYAAVDAIVRDSGGRVWSCADIMQ